MNDGSQIFANFEGPDVRRLEVSVRDVLEALSTALDAVDNRLITHHHIVAYISMRIAKAIGLAEADTVKCIESALVHDLGLVRNFHEAETPIAEREFDLRHPIVGAQYLAEVPHFRTLATIVRYHHFSYANLAKLRARGTIVPKACEVIYAADSVALQIENMVPANWQDAQAAIRTHAMLGHKVEYGTEITDALLSMIETEEFWLDLRTNRMARELRRFDRMDELLRGDEISQVAGVFSLLIDGRSRFTANHSFGVAFLSQALATAKGWSPSNALRLKIAGHLHDIGKLSVPNALIEKPAKLSDAEWRIMRSHTFHTRRILEAVEGLGPIVDWAADHHECLDGTGYPSRKRGDAISEGSRIMTVADIVTALTEHRPYRSQLPKETVFKILRDRASAGLIDGEIVECACDNFEALDHARGLAQHDQNQKSDQFWAGIERQLGTMAEAVGG